MSNDVKIFFPVDVKTEKEARDLLDEVSPYIDVIKIGFALMYGIGAPQAISLAKEYKLPIMADAKFIDIPPTVAGGIEGILKYNVDYVNLMAVGGRTMIEKAIERVDNVVVKYGVKRPKIIAVTVLTSLKFDDLVELGIIPDRDMLEECPNLFFQLPKDVKSQQLLINKVVVRWAEVALKGGADIILSSPLELLRLAQVFPDVELICPGIRPPWSPPDYQGRKLSPYEAVKQGARNLVIGTPIRKPPKGMSRIEVVENIRKDISKALAEQK